MRLDTGLCCTESATSADGAPLFAGAGAGTAAGAESWVEAEAGAERRVMKASEGILSLVNTNII